MVVTIRPPTNAIATKVFVAKHYAARLVECGRMVVHLVSVLVMEIMMMTMTIPKLQPAITTTLTPHSDVTICQLRNVHVLAPATSVPKAPVLVRKKREENTSVVEGVNSTAVLRNL
jgi:hypothetical protein